MERVASQIDRGDLRIENLDAFEMFFSSSSARTLRPASVVVAAISWTIVRAIAAQRLATPVDGDERKQTVLDLVPFAGARQEVADRNGRLDVPAGPQRCC